MSLVVTGASGHLGRLTVQALLDRGVAANRIIATARTPESLADFADLGVVVRHADYSDPQSLKEAFAGADRVLLISSNAVGQRIEQHRNVIEAAQRAGVELLGYTSITRADTSSLALAAEHLATERFLAESGIPHVLLRNSWYFENYTDQIPVQLQFGAVLGAAGSGRVSGASRADYAAGAAAAIAAEDQAGKIYEFGGDFAFTLADYAAALAAAAGTEVAYQDLPQADYAAALESNGVPKPFAEILADSDRGIAEGELLADSGELAKLIGRPTTALADAVAAALPA